MTFDTALELTTIPPQDVDSARTLAAYLTCKGLSSRRNFLRTTVPIWGPLFVLLQHRNHKPESGITGAALPTSTWQIIVCT